MTPYQILGLKEPVTMRAVKGAYHGLSNQYHPDKNPDNEEAKSKFFEITEAYKKIKSEAKELFAFLDIPEASDSDIIRAAYNKKLEFTNVALKKGEKSVDKDLEKLKKVHTLLLSEQTGEQSGDNW